MNLSEAKVSLPADQSRACRGIYCLKEVIYMKNEKEQTHKCSEFVVNGQRISKRDAVNLWRLGQLALPFKPDQEARSHEQVPIRAQDSK